MSTVTIQYVELDDGNVPHVTRHGVTLTEVETLLLTASRFAATGAAELATTGRG